ncbi:MAG: hypothetical protein WBP41_07880 [Saprospiraceae bacterium]
MTKFNPYLRKRNVLWLMPSIAFVVIIFYDCKFDSSKSSGTDSTAQQITNADPQKSSDEKQTTFLNVTKIAKQPKDVVDAYLGPPNFHETISPSNAPCPCEKYSYKESNIEIVFMNNKADWITVYKMNDIKYDSASILQALGLKYTTPFHQDDYVIKWNDFDGFDQLSAFGDSKGGLSYIFLKAITH